MVRYLPPAVVLWTAAFCCAQPHTPAGGDGQRSFTTRSANLHRVKDLFTGDVRVLWIGDSWCLEHHTARLPYGSLLVWPFDRLEAVSVGFNTSGLGGSADYTSGPGALTPVDSDHGWIAETNEGVPARIALPVNNMTRVDGEAGLVLNAGWSGPPRVQDLGIRNGFIDMGDLPAFTGPGDEARVRVLYYCPRDLPDMVSSVSLLDQDASPLATPMLRAGARPFWHLGEVPDVGLPRTPVASQINALASDLALSTGLGTGPRVVIAEDPAAPLVGSGQGWFLAGGVFYRADGSGHRLPGYYHSVLATVSWQLNDFATSAQSNGNKRFTDEQLVHWLDVTTLDRGQRPIVVLHIATEQLSELVARQRVEAICQRYRDAFGAIGAAAPRFLLIGPYLSRTLSDYQEIDRAYCENFNSAEQAIAEAWPDCAFVSLYAMTDGVYFTTDARGGPGTQQAARDWLDANGWSTITYGGVTYNLSTAENGGLDGVLSPDGLHLGATPGAALFAKLIAEEIEGAKCPADFNGDGSANTQDVLWFLNAWAGADPSADFDGNGAVDTRDVIAFLNAWVGGC